ncbi:MAG: hypothetical protein R3C44_05840 [Chloroflexota bacterium]
MDDAESMMVQATPMLARHLTLDDLIFKPFAGYHGFCLTCCHIFPHPY